jgi:hypothetical protein
MDPIFVTTQRVYQSYACFWKLVRLSGFQAIPTTEVDLKKDALYIVTPFTEEHALAFGPRSSGRRAVVAWLNLERPDSGRWPPVGANASNDEEACLRFADIMWTYDLSLLASRPGSVLMPFGSHPDLAERAPAQKRWDFAHLSYVVPRREEVYAELRRRGLSEAPNEPGPDRPQVLSATRVILQVHQTPALVGSPQRAAVAAAYGLPLVSETLSQPWPMMFGWDHLQAPREKLADVVQSLIERPAEMSRLGARLRETLCFEIPFREGVVMATEETLLRLGRPS